MDSHLNKKISADLFERLELLGNYLSEDLQAADLSETDLIHAQRELNEITDLIYENRYDMNDRMFLIHEVQALIYWASGNEELAFEQASIANEKCGMYHLTRTTQAILSEKESRKSEYRGKQRSKIKWALLGMIILGTFIFNSDQYVIMTADSNMVSLAEDAGMTYQGKVQFLRSYPTIIDEGEIRSVCSGTDIGKSGIPLGCFDPNTERIYIRDLPTKYDYYERTIAVHEMLHAAYFRSKPNDSILQAINSSGDSASIKKVLKEYEFTDSEEQLDEKHSYVAIYRKSITYDLDQYYSKYLSERSYINSLHRELTADFATQKKQMDKIEKAIKAGFSVADQYYSSHAAAANYGDVYNTNLYYELYENKLNETNRMVKKYNSKVNKYNESISIISGKPVEDLTPQKF